MPQIIICAYILVTPISPSIHQGNSKGTSPQCHRNKTPWIQFQPTSNNNTKRTPEPINTFLWPKYNTRIVVTYTQQQSPISKTFPGSMSTLDQSYLIYFISSMKTTAPGLLVPNMDSIQGTSDMSLTNYLRHKSK